jgi:hypothetical protein
MFFQHNVKIRKEIIKERFWEVGLVFGQLGSWAVPPSLKLWRAWYAVV